MSKNMIIKAIFASLSVSASTCVIAAENQDLMPTSLPGMERCFGIVKKGMNDCGNAGHNCSGEAKQDADKKEWVFVPKGLCKRIVGGSSSTSQG